MSPPSPRRPGALAGVTCTTPLAEGLLTLGLHGPGHKGFRPTRAEYDALRHLYGYREELPRGDTTVAKDVCRFMQAGADLALMRTAQVDGLRLVAWLARYLPAGQDPLAVLVNLAGQAGWDVDVADLAWAQARVDGEETEEEEKDHGS